MANDLNQCNFVGRAGKDCELRYTPAGKAVATFSMAVGKQWKDAQGDKQEATEWINCVVWGALAEIAGKYVTKGKQLFITGEMQTRSYDDREGVKKYITEINVRNLQLLGSKGDGLSGQGKPFTPEGQQEQQRQQQVKSLDDPTYDPDEDIPF